MKRATPQPDQGFGIVLLPQENTLGLGEVERAEAHRTRHHPGRHFIRVMFVRLTALCAFPPDFASSEKAITETAPRPVSARSGSITNAVPRLEHDDRKLCALAGQCPSAGNAAPPIQLVPLLGVPSFGGRTELIKRGFLRTVRHQGLPPSLAPVQMRGSTPGMPVSARMTGEVAWRLRCGHERGQSWGSEGCWVCSLAFRTGRTPTSASATRSSVGILERRCDIGAAWRRFDAGARAEQRLSRCRGRRR